ncbi:MAG: hypothetical protein IT481_11675 [Gammaproteobacteria bacterium]|nr:hypothetical protein [Gammaproteobacteria bacterium]
MPISLDDLVFCGAAATAFVLLHLWLRRRSRSSGLPWAVAVAVIGALLAGNWLVERNARQTVEKLERAVMGFAPSYAIEIERLGHARIGSDTPPEDPTYLELIAAQKRWLAANPVVNDIYTFRLIDAENVALIVDSETDYDPNGRFEGERESRTEIGETLELGGELVAEAAAGRGVIDSEPYTDRWGTWVPAYWPLHDAEGRVEAIVGVDYAASAWVAEVRAARLTSIVTVAVVLLMLLRGQHALPAPAGRARSAPRGG